MTLTGFNSSRVGGGTCSLWLLIIILITLNYGLLVLSTPANVVARKTEHRMDKISAIKLAKKFTCKKPLPHAFYLRDLAQSLKLFDPDERANQPIYIVVKRCGGHSGCCTTFDMTCTAVAADVYTEDVQIEIVNVVSNKTRLQWISVEQHGSCACSNTTLNDRARLETEKPKVTLI